MTMASGLARARRWRVRPNSRLVLAFAGQEAALHALALQAQHDHHVHAVQALGRSVKVRTP